ncbi:MAG: GTPase HflX [Patescibacteria group bacterium]
MKMFHNTQKLKAILIDVVTPEISKEEAMKRLMELENLVNTYGGIVVVKAIQKRGIPDYETYIGKGKVQEIFQLAQEKEAQILVINNILKPKQIFNLDESLRKANMKTWDRIDLILKIFDKHAKTTEAKLQIELASIRHIGPRIYGMGIELSQQTGAVGLRSGQGETNIELMKRHLKKQELNIIEKLKHYELINQGHRDRRRRQNFKTVAIVGYTNAGKSSLLNALTGKDVYIADELFATLDTRVGKLYIQPAQKPEEQYKYVPGKEVMISDTIGFIQNLPPELIQAFKSTLAETIESDLILHIIDINDPDLHQKTEVVEEILDQLGLHDKPKLYVFNKVDLLAHRIVFEEKEIKRESSILKAGAYTAHLLGWTDNKKHKAAAKKVVSLKRKYKEFSPLFVSAAEKINMDKLIKAIDERV